ncbi:MAG TPA: protein kinase [Solirubrobacteraceae bacterium]|nr:protein kinase [Solirubrobacteraceae bacterium]
MSPDTNQSLERPLGLPDRYRVKRHIASGGMASVWCAEDRVLSRNVAVKVLAERFADDHVAVLRFKREARAAARVSNHPHVVTVYDVGELEPPVGADATRRGGGAFIVMEFLAGGTVADAIRHDSVRRPEAMRWLAEAASALDHAHGRGIVHRDIKPANFLLDRARMLHVADFGIAHLATEDTLTSSDQLFGTAAYLSPEQALGREATGASDRYALAVAAFELLTGERPFSAEHFSAQARQHIEEPPPAASEVDHSLPPAVDEVLFTGLAKDPAARPESAGAFVAALEEALRGGWPSGDASARLDARRGRPRIPDPAAPGASTAAARRRERTSATRPPTSRSAAETGAERGRHRAVAVGAIVLAVAVVAGIALATMRGGHATGHAGARVADRASKTVTTHRKRTVTAARTRTTQSHATTTPVSSTTTETQTAVNLEATGHQDILEGNYAGAIPVLEQAVAAAPHDSPTYAYALYDLGHAEVLNGDPQAAIPVLRQRLQINNQRDVVRSLLAVALRQTGQGQAGTGSGGASAGTTNPSTTPATPGTPARPGSGGAGLTGPGSGGRVPHAKQPTPPEAGPPGRGAHARAWRRWWRHHDRHHHADGFSLLVAAIG